MYIASTCKYCINIVKEIKNVIMTQRERTTNDIRDDCDVRSISIQQ